MASGDGRSPVNGAGGGGASGPVLLEGDLWEPEGIDEEFVAAECARWAAGLPSYAEQVAAGRRDDVEDAGQWSSPLPPAESEYPDSDFPESGSPESGSPEAVVSPVPVIEAAYLARVVAIIEEQVQILGRIDTVGLRSADRRALMVRTETVQRALFGYTHTWIADLIAQHGLDDIPGSVPHALSLLMRFSRGGRVRWFV
nr:hypothetical protein [Rhodococcus sp. (in: high G+C Gram-positive bacteria)]